GVCWRQPGATGRTQCAGSGTIRNADSGWTVHGKFPRNHRCLSRCRCFARDHSTVVDRDRAAIAGGPRRKRCPRSPGFRGHALATWGNRADRKRAAGVAIGAGRCGPSRNDLGAARVNPLAALYSAAVRARNELYDRGTLSLSHLQGPVVSIGNITVGGSGKTPFLILLGELLKQYGIPCDVLSRGYRRLATGTMPVDPAGSPRQYGDEPLLIARKLGVPVIVGEDRYAAGRLAEEKFGPRLHLLDDGFQQPRRARKFDIVLPSPGDARDSLLPPGRLREPLSSLTRADAIVLTNDTAGD